jgi:hypothetical protein
MRLLSSFAPFNPRKLTLNFINSKKNLLEILGEVLSYLGGVNALPKNKIIEVETRHTTEIFFDKMLQSTIFFEIFVLNNTNIYCNGIKVPILFLN